MEFFNIEMTNETGWNFRSLFGLEPKQKKPSAVQSAMRQAAQQQRAKDVANHNAWGR